MLSVSDTDEGTEHANTSLAISMQAVPPSDVCISAVARLVELFGPENTFIVSKCGTKTQQATIVWLTVNRFFERTRLSPSHVYFCKNRSGIDSDDFRVVYELLPPPTPQLLQELSAATCRAEEEVSAMFGDAKVALNSMISRRFHTHLE